MLFWSKFIPRTFILFVDLFSFTIVLKTFFKPYRRDYTAVGYAMGILFRFWWLAISGIILLAVLAVLLTGFVIYLIIPFYLIFAVLTGGEVGLAGLAGIAFVYLVYFVTFASKPQLILEQVKKPQELVKVCLPQVLSMFNQLKDKKYTPLLFWETIIKQPSMSQYFVRLGLSDKAKIEQLTDEVKALRDGVNSEVVGWRQISWKALGVGLSLGRRHLSCELLFLAWVKLETEVERLFDKHDLTWEQLNMASQWLYAWELRKQTWRFWEDRFFHRRAGVNAGWAAGWLRHLKHFSTNITDLVKQGKVPYLIGRKKLMERIVGVLQQTTRNNVLLIGAPGVGKTTIAYGIAEKILSGHISGKLAGKKLIRLDLAGLLSGTSGRGDMEERVYEAIREVQGGESILFIEEIHTLFGAGGRKGTADVASFIAPALSSGNIQLVATTTPEEYRRHIEGNTTVASYFQVVQIEEPSQEECLRILQWFVPQMEADQGVRITLPALTAAVSLTQKFIHDRYLPGKAVELLDITAVYVKQKGRSEVSDKDIAAVLSQQTQIPLEQLTANEQEKLLNLEELLHQRIINQEEAVRMVSNALRRARSGLAPGNRPIASFLFVGPTGVGKTETAKALSATYFGSERNMIRLDMSEYSLPGQIYRLIGAPPGQAGYQEGGYLTEAVRSRPFAVVLFDEIEKAHTEVHNILLQILDDGRLTDGKGRTIDFTNTMVICTSNAFSVVIQEMLKKGSAINEIKEMLMQNLQQVFRPELLNRFDGVVVFKTLTMDQVEQIARLILNTVAGKMREQRVEVSFTNEIVHKLAQEGYDPQFGARPLRRVIQERVEDKLARMLLEGKLAKGDVYEFGDTQKPETTSP